MKREVIITCEHASCDVPREYRALFRGQRRVLRSHRGYDPKSIEFATALATRLKCRLLQGTVTRLLVELNRSIGHRALFSEFTQSLPEAERLEILNAYYVPYRAAVERQLLTFVRKRRTVLHLSIHTFAPVLDGKRRHTDIGLLYDPARAEEALLMKCWQRQMTRKLPDLRTRRNYPYRGQADGFTTELRKKFSAAEYLGIEIEVCNSMRPRTIAWQELVDVMASLARDYRAETR